MPTLCLSKSVLSCVLLGALFASAPADACSFDRTGIGFRLWPHPDSDGVPTNSGLLIEATLWPDASLEVSLSSADGGVGLVEVSRVSVSPDSPTSMVFFKPSLALEPETVYSVTANAFAENGRLEDSKSWSFKTGAGPLDEVLAVEPPEYFHVHDVIFHDECGQWGGTARHVVFSNVPVTAVPLVYSVTLYDEDGSTPSAVLATPVHFAEKKRWAFSVHSSGLEETRCASLSVMNALGQTASSEVLCDPMCVDDRQRTLPADGELWPNFEEVCVFPKDEAPTLETPEVEPETMVLERESAGCASAQGKPLEGVGLWWMLGLAMGLRRSRRTGR